MTLKEKIKTKEFKYGVLIIVFLLIVSLSFFIINNNPSKETSTSEYKNQLIVFVQDNCGYCKDAEDFLAENKFNGINVIFYNLKDKDSVELLFDNINRLNIPKDGLGTPIFIFNNNYILGFGQNQEKELLEVIKNKRIR